MEVSHAKSKRKRRGFHASRRTARLDAKAQPKDSQLRRHDTLAGWDAPELCRRALGLAERLSGAVDEHATSIPKALALHQQEV